MKEIQPYTTWYDFRKDLGKYLGYIPLNHQWLQIKPRVALPWDESLVQVSLSRIKKQTRRNESIEHQEEEIIDPTGD